MRKSFLRRKSKLTHQLIGAKLQTRNEPELAEELNRFAKLRWKKKRKLTSAEKQERTTLEKALVERSVKALIPLYHLRLDIVIVAIALVYHVGNLSLLFPDVFYKLFEKAPTIHSLSNLFPNSKLN